MNAPTKAELYDRIAALEKENARLQAELDSEKIRRWNERIPTAYNCFYQKMHEVYLGQIANAKFVRVDGSGYWFTYNLLHDPTEQTYCVRHTDFN